MKNYKNPLPFVLAGLLVFLSAGVLVLSSFDDSATEETFSDAAALAEAPEETHFGIPMGQYSIEEHSVGKNDFLSTILQRHGIELTTIHAVAEKSRDVFDVRRISVGNPYTVFKDQTGKASFFVYQPNAIDYVVYDLRDSIHVYAEQKDVERRVEQVAGVIDGSLYMTLQDQGASTELAVQLAEIYGWAINFYRINKGDWFKIMYERTYVEGEPVGTGRISSAVFSHNGKEYQAHYFQGDDEEKGGYYDENGKSLRRSFLRAPVKYTRISSQYTMRRLHPVQRVWRAHLGTDFAAPHGTPIIATGDGVVVESAYGSGNGNYVKIKHDDVYSTQYLHMSKRAVKKGQRVVQGEVIGYVGSTGLATGPHVCYRFWKHGKQVDAMAQVFPPSTPIKEAYQIAFTRMLNQQQQQLAKLDIQGGPAELAYKSQLLNLGDLLSQAQTAQPADSSVTFIHHSML